MTQGVPDEDSAQPSPVSADERRSSSGGGHAGLITVVVLIMLAAAGYLGYRFWRNRRLDESYLVDEPPPAAPPVAEVSAPRILTDAGQATGNGGSKTGGGHWTDHP